MPSLALPFPLQRCASLLCPSLLKAASQADVLPPHYKQGLDYTWCKSPDVGLPLPDLTCFLSVSPDVAASRGGFGEERYESREMQAAVRRVFATIAGEVGPQRWREVNADGTMEDVERELLSLAEGLLAQEGRPAEVGELWR